MTVDLMRRGLGLAMVAAMSLTVRAAFALPSPSPGEDAQGVTSAVAVTSPLGPQIWPVLAALPDEVAMVLAGTALIGVAAALRRAA